jgi:hypothetical protein
MAMQVTGKEVHEMLDQYLGNRSDLGLWRVVTTLVMEPKNLFETESKQKPQRGFVLFSIVTLVAVGAFVYFNFWN